MTVDKACASRAPQIRSMWYHAGTRRAWQAAVPSLTRSAAGGSGDSPTRHAANQGDRIAVLSIQKSDLEPILATHPGNRALAKALQRISTGDELLRALGRYIHFNSAFGGGVANLAGEIAVRQELFRDRDEAVQIIAD